MSGGEGETTSVSPTPSPADKVHICVLCGTKFVGWGNNPEPVADFDQGKACDPCNATVVIPARLGFTI